MYTNLKLQIWKSGLRQNRLAQLVGMHETVLSKIVNGFRKPSAGTRARIAEVLRCDEGWLFECQEDAAGGMADPLTSAGRVLDPSPPELLAVPDGSGGLQ